MFICKRHIELTTGIHESNKQHAMAYEEILFDNIKFSFILSHGCQFFISNYFLFGDNMHLLSQKYKSIKLAFF